MYEKEYKFALANQHIAACRLLISLANMYARHPDKPTLGLIQGAVDDVRKEMSLLKM